MAGGIFAGARAGCFCVRFPAAVRPWRRDSKPEDSDSFRTTIG
jgi:hypothetical protein